MPENEVDARIYDFFIKNQIKLDIKPEEPTKPPKPEEININETTNGQN